MKGWVVFLALVPVVASWAGQVGPQATPDEVHDALRAVAASRELRETIRPLLDVAMASGKVSPVSALEFLRRVGELEHREADAVLELLLQGLQRRAPLDKWMSGALMLWRMPEPPPWQTMLATLDLRMRLLLATQAAFLRLRMPQIIGEARAHDAVLEETARAIWDQLPEVWVQAPEEWDPAESALLEGSVRQRLLTHRQRGTLAATALDALLEVLSPELVEEIVTEALQTERR